MFSKGRKDRPTYQQKLSNFRFEADVPFDLANVNALSCPPATALDNTKFQQTNKRRFLKDQKRLRRMIIGSVDKEENIKVEKRS